MKIYSWHANKGIRGKERKWGGSGMGWMFSLENETQVVIPLWQSRSRLSALDYKNRLCESFGEMGCTLSSKAVFFSSSASAQRRWSDWRWSSLCDCLSGNDASNPHWKRGFRHAVQSETLHHYWPTAPLWGKLHKHRLI